MSRFAERKRGLAEKGTGSAHFDQELVGGPLTRSRRGLLLIACHPQPVVPLWQEFKVRLPRPNGTPEMLPLFDECRGEVPKAEVLLVKAGEPVERPHAGGTVTPPPAARKAP